MINEWTPIITSDLPPVAVLSPAYYGVPQSPITKVRGWLTDKEESELIRLAQYYTPDQNAMILELGGEYGRSASAFAYAMRSTPNSQVHTIDLFPEDHGVVGDLYSVWQANTEAYREHAQIVGHQGNSNKYPRGLSKMGWHVLFVDANHHYEYVKADLEKWAKHVLSGGVMILHDYAKHADSHSQHHEVKRAADEWFSQQGSGWEFHDIEDTSLVFYVRLEDG